MTAVKKTTVKKAADTIADAIAAARVDLDQLRDRIADLLGERQEIESTVCDRAEAERRVAAMIEQARTNDPFNRPLFFAADDTRFDPRLDHYFTETLRRNPLEALAAVCPEGWAAAFLSHRPGGGLSPDARAARLAKIERDLSAAEIAEEITTREVESVTGGTVPHRLDANSAVLLAPDHELEGSAA